MSCVKTDDIHSLEDIYKRWDSLVSDAERPQLEAMIARLCELNPQTNRAFNKAFLQLRKEFKACPKKSVLLHVFREMDTDGRLPAAGTSDPLRLRSLLVKKSGKSSSGVLVITVLTSPYPAAAGRKPQKFSCQWDCHYCPAEPGQPRSYLHDEPAVLRANRDQFCPILQFHDRAATLAMNGHPVDKVELLVLGGTWSSYPHDYQEEFCRDLFFAANTFWGRHRPGREPLSLEAEQRINESARTKIIGLTLETRPDCINLVELRRFRRYGCTRVQIGVQHTDDAVLRLVNRGHGLRESVDGLRMLMDCGFKVDLHLMPDLPGSSLQKDRAMLDRVLFSSDLRGDQLKLYPHSVVPWTRTKKWLDEGKFRPMSSEALCELLIWFKSRVHPWIRLNRVVRDIPGHYISGGNDVTNLRQVLQERMACRGLRCACIRCREVGRSRERLHEAEMVVRRYRASGGDEYFLSFETPDRRTIFGFLRLRITRRAGTVPARFASGLGRRPGARVPSYDPRWADDAPETAEGNAWGLKAGETPPSRYSEACAAAAAARADETNPAETTGDASVFPELAGCALVRELHVYGQLIETRDKEGQHAQHAGYGRRMMRHAEKIAAAEGLARVAVIAGVGTRNYYRKLGYVLRGRGRFLVKRLPKAQRLWWRVASRVSFPAPRPIDCGDEPLAEGSPGRGGAGFGGPRPYGIRAWAAQRVAGPSLAAALAALALLARAGGSLPWDPAQPEAFGAATLALCAALCLSMALLLRVPSDARARGATATTSGRAARAGSRKSRKRRKRERSKSPFRAHGELKRTVHPRPAAKTAAE
jgi:ELP3 family radical SAM enzyme/protein acetyltransferase